MSDVGEQEAGASGGHEPSRLRLMLGNPNALSAVLAAAVGGALAILGGLAGSQLTLQGQRSLEKEQRQFAVRGAARQLDLEMFVRARMLVASAGLPIPAANVRIDRNERAWECLADLRVSSGVRSVPRGRCGAAGPSSNPDRAQIRPQTRLRQIAWSTDDRRVLGSNLTASQWFYVTTATDDWRDFAEHYRSLGTLQTHRPSSTATYGTMLQELVAARKVLAPYVS